MDVLTNLGDADENSFDVDQLCEMITAYIPEFAQVDRCETHCIICANYLRYHYIATDLKGHHFLVFSPEKA